MEMIILTLIAWLIAPVPLGILYARAEKKKKQREQMLTHLFMQGRLSPDELRLAGMELPRAAQPSAVQVPVQSPVQLTQTITPPAGPAPDPETALAAAAERAAQIAEAELSGEPISVPEPAAEKAVTSAVSDAAETPAQPETVLTEEPAAETAAPDETAPEAEAPAAELPAADVKPEFQTVPQTAPVQPVPQPVPVLQNRVPVPQQYTPQKSGFNVSAITVMLSVAVLMIITAGLIFIRSAWSSLSDFGRLATLTAGSVLFFGTSALARRIWKLNRTGMAFFVLGSAFLPISIWAAGYLELLGEGLSGAGNPWLLALSFGSFAVIAAFAVKIYQQPGWGIGLLCGLTAAYVAAADGIKPEGDLGVAVLLIALAVYVLILVYGARLLRQQQLLPLAIGRIIEPFALVIMGLVSFVVLSSLPMEEWQQLASVAVFLTAFAYFAPAVTERMREFSAIPASILAVIGFGQLLSPIYNSVFVEGTEKTYHFPVAYFSLLLTIAAIVWLILLLTNSLPENTRKGYYISAMALTGLSILMMMPQLSGTFIIMPAALAVQLILWLIAARKKPSQLLRALIAVQGWALAIQIAKQLGRFLPHDVPAEEHFAYESLIWLGMFAVCMTVFVLTKKHRSSTSDLLFSLSICICAVIMQICGKRDDLPMQLGGAGVMAAMVAFYWFMALRRDTQRPVQYFYAFLSPAVLFTETVVLADRALQAVDSVLITIGWSIVSIAIGMVTYLTTKRRFHNVRRLFFALTILPPLIFAVLGEALDSGDWIIVQQLICAAAAIGLWFLFANRGFHKLEIASFSVMLVLVLESTYYLLRDFVFDGVLINVCLVTSLWIILFSLLAMAVSKRALIFVGNSAVPAVMQVAAPCAALIFSGMIWNMFIEEWDLFLPVYGVALSIVAWFTTKKHHIILPALSELALFMAMESCRYHASQTSGGYVVLFLFICAGLTVLFPYVGAVLRENDTEPKEMRRSWVLTALGGVIPFWPLLAVSRGTQMIAYHSDYEQWMIFLIPVLLAGFILHFAKLPQTEKNAKAFATVSAALGMIALWMQPFFDVADTYWEGKLHILPMIAFGIVLRLLYGEKAGGGFLFGVGVYTMLRLGFGAMATERGDDLMTVLAVALIMFVASFYIKQKKWFLLGGISLVLTAMYMHMKLTDGTQWWVYLLIAGLVLLGVAASNEMLKQRGDSLKARAGRLWEDWTW